jgi:hypothetical protein
MPKPDLLDIARNAPLAEAVAALRRSHDEINRMIDEMVPDPDARAYLRKILNQDRLDEMEAGLLAMQPIAGTA